MMPWMDHVPPSTPAPPPATAPPAAPPEIESDPDIDLFCPGCGYDLRALRGEACPECGAAVDLDKLRATGIPWVLGVGPLGKAWGFLRTCEQAGLRPTRFCREVAKPVALRDARWFRRVVVVLVWLTLPAIAIGDWVLFSIWDGTTDEWGYFFEDTGLSPAWSAVVLCVLLLLFLLGFTGMHLWAMHPGDLPAERQNRAVALGHYACAPLVILPFILALRTSGALVALVGEELSIGAMEDIGILVWAVSWLLLLVPVLLFWRCCYVFAGKAAHRSGMAQAGLALGLPLLWLGWGVLVFFVLPAVVGFVYLFFLTG